MTPPRLRYTLALPRPHTHLADVVVDVPDLGSSPVRLVMPAWTPGWYKIYDYVKHVQEFRVEDRRGRPVPFRKTDKATWRVDARGPFVARYRVYANDWTVATNHLDDTHGFFNGAGTFVYVDGRKDLPSEVVVRAPRGWRTATGLDPVAGRPAAFRAPDYDVLADCPLEIGTHAEAAFTVRGIRHRIVVHGGGNHPPLETLARDFRRIVEVEAAMFGGVPYPHFTFILHNTPERMNGLEHLNSTALQWPRFGYRPREKYLDFLSLVAHEFFHLWNVKRIRPLALGPFDYARENYTELLWVMEGITNYYDELFLRRAGFLKPKKYLDLQAKRLRKVQETPGRLVQSLADSSFDTWTKYYQPGEHSPNMMISYYDKGQVVGMCLDLEIRRRTRGRRSLDDVMRTLYERYAKRGAGFPESAFEAVVAEIAPGPWTRFFGRSVRGTADPDYADHLASAGLRLVARASEKPAEKGADPEASRPKPYLGVRVGDAGGRVVIQSVLADGPAFRDGLSAGDEVVALDGFRVSRDSLDRRLGDHKPGDRLRFAVFRRDRLADVDVTLAPPQKTVFEIQPAKRVSAAQKAVYRSWIGKAWPPR